MNRKSRGGNSGLGPVWCFALALAVLSVRARSQGPAQTPSARFAISGAPAGITAFMDVGVVPMDTDRVLEHQTVLVEGGRIKAMGPVHQVQVPAGATTIVGKGDYLIPGLTDMHVHFFLDQPGGLELKADSAGIENRMFIWLANGATTVRNMDWLFVSFDQDSAPERVALTKERYDLLMHTRTRAAAGTLLGPRLYTPGPWMDVGTFEVKNATVAGADVAYHIAPKDVAKHVATYKQAGFDFLKPYLEPIELFDSLAAAGRRQGLPLAGHVPPTIPIEHAILRMKSIEHLTGYNKRNLNDTAIVRQLVEATRKAGTWNCVTLAILEEFTSRGLTINSAGPEVPYGKLVKALSDAGARILAGTDALPQRGTLSAELQALVKAGLSPYQALVAATRDPAEYLGTQRETGTITVGKRADLVLLAGNPLRQIRYTADIDGVMIGGRWVPRDSIDRRMTAIITGQ